MTETQATYMIDMLERILYVLTTIEAAIGGQQP